MACTSAEDVAHAEESKQTVAKAEEMSGETGSTGDEEQERPIGSTQASSEEESGEDPTSGANNQAEAVACGGKGEGEADTVACGGKGEGEVEELGEKQAASLSTDMFASQPSAYIGYLAQYFAVGIIHSGVPATIYGVFLGYLNVPAYVYVSVLTVSKLPWTFKFFFGVINDTRPICGLRRKPYMMIGWTLCTIALLWLSFTPLPEPYWCIDEEGGYIEKRTLPDGSITAAVPCNPEAAKHGGKYAFILMVACLGYVVADVAADGLTTQYAKNEPIERRGSIQTTAYLTRTLGGIISTVFVGVCMNGRKYNGSFSWSLSFEQVAMVMAIPAALMVPLSGYLVVEPRDPAKKVLTSGEYWTMSWELLKSKSMFFVIIYCFCKHAILGISTPASGMVKKYWAEVENFQNQMFSLVGLLLFACGLALVKRYLLNKSWRVMLTVTIIFLQVVDCAFSSLTIFDVVRNEYFYLGETVLVEIPSAANFVISTFVVVEMADDGNEGMVYGLLTTASNLGGPVARAIANELYTVFTPSLSDSKNYIEDSPEFRTTVFYSFLLSYFFPILSLATVWYFLPNQKQETQERKRTWKKRPIYGIFTICLLSVAFTYALAVNFAAMVPSTMCLKLAGGPGCHN